MSKELVTVPASYEILSDLDKQSIPVGTEYCGRICYKSEGRITSDSALSFCREIAERGHNSVLEMRVKSFLITIPGGSVDALIALNPKYLIIDDARDNQRYYMKEILITGSVRAFREMAMLYPDCIITSAIAVVLEQRYPFFFADIKSSFRKCNTVNCHVNPVPLKNMIELIDNFKSELFLRHRHIGVKFTVNRAVTHEIVRHRPCSFLQESQRYCRYSDDKFGKRVTFIEPMFFKKDSPEYQIWEESMLFEEKQYFKLLETSSPQASRTVLPNSCKTEIIVFANLVEWNHILHMRTSPAAEPSMREVMIPLQKDFCKMFLGFDFNRRFPENFVQE